MTEAGLSLPTGYPFYISGASFAVVRLSDTITVYDCVLEILIKITVISLVTFFIISHLISSCSTLFLLFIYHFQNFISICWLKETT